MLYDTGTSVCMYVFCMYSEREREGERQREREIDR